MNILEAMADARFFKPLFKDAATWEAWRVFLAALFEPGEAGFRLYKEATGRGKWPGGAAQRAFVIAGRRSGKSFISALVATYLAAFREWRPHLSPGERAMVLVIAVDKEQASIVRHYVGGFLRAVPALRAMLEKETAEGLALKNRVTIAVKACNFRALRGFTVAAAILEELAFWRSEESANPDRKVMRALEPALASVPGSLLLGISTPYSRSGALWDEFRAGFGVEDGPLVWRAPTATMNPTLAASTIERALRVDPEAARAEWLAEWREDLAGFVSSEVVEAVTYPGRFELPKLQGAAYVAAIDPSGGRNDSFTLAVAHRDQKTERAVLDVLREVKPPFKPQGVVEEFSRLLKDYGLREVVSDRFAGEWVAEAFDKCEVKVVPAELTASEAYLELLPLLMNGGIELLDHKRLKAQLSGLERRVRSGGKDIVTHYQGGHDDCANAVALALLQAKRSAESGFYIGWSRRNVW
ncbi:MAG: hypothetical protein A2V67_12605 [Deltaproteobacteria bacterium RBG_13_61_14]|nr:MAG: hypothetical protein A2V67_12605 [Deltaproteobacteria bacterium RBG_13_61_14]